MTTAAAGQLTHGKDPLVVAGALLTRPGASASTHAAVDESRLDEVAREVTAVLRRSGLDRTLAIGALILDRFFDGSVSAWRSRRNLRNNSVRRLANRPGCPLSRSSLNRAVGICAAVRACPAILGLPNVGAGHIGIVLSLGAEEAEGWLRKADARGWSVRQLVEAIRTERLDKGARRGRPTTSRWQRALSASRSSLARLEDQVSTLVEMRADNGDPNLLAELGERLALLRATLLGIEGVELSGGPHSAALPADSRQRNGNP
jgi:hypothetical protein